MGLEPLLNGRAQYTFVQRKKPLFFSGETYSFTVDVWRLKGVKVQSGIEAD